jgi:hypothetical protein
MDIMTVYGVDCLFACLVTALAMAGYFITRKRTGESWPLWILLGLGWGLLALLYGALSAGRAISREMLLSIWLSSYVLVAASLLLLFLKLIRMLRQQRAQ